MRIKLIEDLPMAASAELYQFSWVVEQLSADAGSSLGLFEQRMSKGLLDFAIVAGQPSRAGVRSKHIGEINFFWVASQALIGNDESMKADLLARLPVISSSAGTGSTRVLNDWLDLLNLRIGQRLNCNSWAGVPSLLCEGLGMGIRPTGWALPITRFGDLRLLWTAQPLPPLRYSFHWRSEDWRPLIGSMVDTVKECSDFEVPVRWLQQPDIRMTARSQRADKEGPDRLASHASWRSRK